jgi:hypothetical protein
VFLQCRSVSVEGGERICKGSVESISRDGGVRARFKVWLGKAWLGEARHGEAGHEHGEEHG